MTTPTASLVIETHNLHGAALDAQHAALDRLLRHLAPQLAPHDDLEIVLTHEGVAEPHHASALAAALGRPIAHVIVPDGATYYDAKNAGFHASHGDVVVFADSDCWPSPGWLEGLLTPFGDPSVGVVAGRTRYRDDTLGRAVSLLDFLYVTRREGERVLTRNFYANNVAFRREVFAAHAYRAGQPFFRGHCQVLGLELAEAGIPIDFRSDAVTVHRFPDRLAELFELRMRRGGDLAHLAPRISAYLGLSVAPSLATTVAWIARSAIAHETLRESALSSFDRLRVEGTSLAVATLDGIGSIVRRDVRARGLGYVTDRDGLARDTGSQGLSL